MPRHLLIVPDKFKGTLTAEAAADAIARGWLARHPGDVLECLPMSDGGDGFGEVLRRLTRARPRRVRTVDAAHRDREAVWWFAPSSRTAIVESTQVIGLALLPTGRFHPFELDSKGLGAVLESARRAGARRCLVGIGGSATNDGGFGLARAVGWQFLDRQDRAMTRWTDLHRLDSIRAPRRPIGFEEVVVAVDVRNPLLGPRGCSRIYGPQKGLRPGDFPLAEACLGRLATVVRRELGIDFRRAPGAGAAGGLGFGLMTFLGAAPRSGFELFAEFAGLEKRIRAVDLVITGEGAIDESTVMGKGVGEVARMCRRFGIPCVGLAGTLNNAPVVNRWFIAARGLTEITSAARARSQASHWLGKLAYALADGLRLP